MFITFIKTITNMLNIERERKSGRMPWCDFLIGGIFCRASWVMCFLTQIQMLKQNYKLDYKLSLQIIIKMDFPMEKTNGDLRTWTVVM